MGVVIKSISEYIGDPAELPDLTTGILDLYGPSFGSFGFRKLRRGHDGPAVRVFHTGTEAAADIGFTSTGALDEAALTTFANGGTLAVDRWYDQSGNGRDIIFATRPRLVNAGTIERAGVSPALFADGIDDYAGLSNGGLSLFLVSALQSRLVAAVRKTGASARSIVTFGNPGASTGAPVSLVLLSLADNGFRLEARGGNTTGGDLTQLPSAARTIANHVVTATADWASDMLRLRVDGIEVTQALPAGTSAPTVAPNRAHFLSGSALPPTSFFNGHVAELHFLRDRGGLNAAAFEAAVTGIF
jgi:hypothetical protein